MLLGWEHHHVPSKQHYINVGLHYFTINFKHVQLLLSDIISLIM